MSSLTVNSPLTLPGRVSENLAFKKARAKYVPDFKNGGLRLASVCEFSRPVFNPDDLESAFDPFDVFSLPPASAIESEEEKEEEESSEGSADRDANIRRATRRALVQVFDLCVCNNFDLFSTLTFSEENVDRDSYIDTYHALKVWLSNRVQRKGLKYVAVPEYHHDGHAIHFHMLSNSDPVELVDSGHWAHGEKIFNITSWQKGFSTAQFVTGENAIDATSKYIAKYMTKSKGNKIGGRYYLSGGDLMRPVYVYGDSVKELCYDTSSAVYQRNIIHDWGSFSEYSFI